MKEKLFFIWSIVSRHLLFKKKQTILVIAGVAVGSMVMILTFGITNGIIFDIKNKIIEVSPLITVKGEKVEGKKHLLMKSSSGSNDKFYIESRIAPDQKNEVKPYEKIVSLIDDFKQVDAVSPYVFSRGVIRARTITKQCIIKGIIPDREKNIANLAKKVIKGSLDELTYTSNGVLLGSGLAKKMRLKYHDLIQLTGENGKIYVLKVVGTFESGFSAIDDKNILINLRFAQNIKNYPNNVVSAIGIHTTSLGVVDKTSVEISELTGYKTETWEQENANLLSLFERNNNITLFLVVFVFIVAGFGIANVLITIVLQKRQDIAIMKSFGLSKRNIEIIFVCEGLILGLIGTLLGEVAGHFLTNFISTIPISFGEGAVVRNDHLVTLQTTASFMITGVFSIIVSSISGLGPARRAARLNPVDILRS